MRVLYLDHPEADYLTALVFRGLCEELGPENVVDWAWQPHFHGQVYNGPIPYGPGAVGTCGPYSWMPAFPGRPWGDDEVFSRIKEFDLVVLASPRAYNTQRASLLISRVGRASLPRFVMMDGEDYTSVRWDLILKFRPAVYFKTSLVPNPIDPYPAQRATMQHLVRVVACPLASSFNDPVAAEKTIDVCFLGGSNWFGVRREGVAENRAPVKPQLEERLRQELPGARLVLGQVPYTEYQTTLAASKVAICVSGHGLEGMRTYEAMSCPDTFVIREALPQVTPWPLLDGDTCSTFTSHEQIPTLCKKWLDSEGERLAVARRGNALVQNHYTTRARARYILAEAFR